MREHRSEKEHAAPWHFPVAVEEVAEVGQRYHLVADAETRAAVAQMAALRDLPRLQADFEVTRQGAGGLHVTGVVSATVGQTCVITLEPLANEIAEEVDLLFVPAPAASAIAAAAQKHGQPDSPEQMWDQPELLIGAKLDLGALAIEFLILGIDPYPRKAGAVFEPPCDAKPDKGPFAALAALKKDAREC